MIRRMFVDGAAIGATFLLALFTILANSPQPTLHWTPGRVGLMRLELARDPLDPASERNFGLALNLSGLSIDAERLMSFAGSRSRRDTPTEDWLLLRRLSQGRYDDAFRAVDALLRRDIDEGKRARLSTLLVASAHYDASRPALVARLAHLPRWRLAFMRELGAHAGPADARLVLAGLLTTSKPATDVELAPFLDMLVEHQNYRAAERDWRTFSRPWRNPNFVDDFASPEPFGWRTVFGEGGSSAVENGKLRVEYDGFTDVQLSRRLLALASGPYHLAWRETIDGDPRLTVQVLCAGTNAMLASAPSVAGEQNQKKFLDFSVPPNGCEGQWLAIEATMGERRSSVSGAFSYWALTAPRFR